MSLFPLSFPRQRLCNVTVFLMYAIVSHLLTAVLQHPPAKSLQSCRFLNLPLLCQHLFCNTLVGTLSFRPRPEWQISAVPTAILLSVSSSVLESRGRWRWGRCLSCEYRWFHIWLVCCLWWIWKCITEGRIFFFFKLAFHLVIRQMLSPVGVELVSDSWRIGRMRSREIDGDRPRGMKGSFHLFTTLQLFIFTLSFLIHLHQRSSSSCWISLSHHSYQCFPSLYSHFWIFLFYSIYPPFSDSNFSVYAFSLHYSISKHPHPSTWHCISPPPGSLHSLTAPTSSPISRERAI